MTNCTSASGAALIFSCGYTSSNLEGRVGL